MLHSTGYFGLMLHDPPTKNSVIVQRTETGFTIKIKPHHRWERSRLSAFVLIENVLGEKVERIEVIENGSSQDSMMIRSRQRSMDGVVFLGSG